MADLLTQWTSIYWVLGRAVTKTALREPHLPAFNPLCPPLPRGWAGIMNLPLMSRIRPAEVMGHRFQDRLPKTNVLLRCACTCFLSLSPSPPTPTPITHSPGIQLPCWAAPHGGRPRLLITNRGSEHGPASPPATPLSHQMKPQSQPRVRLYKLVSSLNPVASG